MARYLIRRILQSIPLLIRVSMISFAIIHLAPGGPRMAYEDPRQTAADRLRLEQSLGLDQPLPATLTLMGTPMLLGLLVGIPTGVYAAVHRGSWLDNLVRVVTVAGSAVPSYWLGLILIIALSVNLKIFPAGGMFPLYKPTPDLLDRLRYLVLPATVLATGWWVVLARFMRSETLEVLGQDYVRMARAKGLRERIVLARHILRNVLIPAVTIMGGSLASLFSGAAFTEVVLSWPGLGTMTLDAALKRDYPLLPGVLMIASCLIVLGNLLADLAHGFVDPRVKHE